MPTVYSPPVSTYVPLATITLTSTDSEIVFSSIPATYRDLILIVKGSFASDGFYKVRANGDSSSIYTNVYAQAQYNGGTYSGTNTLTNYGVWDENAYTANIEFMSVSQFMDYSATDKHKTALFRSGGPQLGSTVMGMSAGRYASNSAIHTLAVVGSQNFNIGSTFSLYGIAS
jgi:hypothetical protein